MRGAHGLTHLTGGTNPPTRGSLQSNAFDSFSAVAAPGTAFPVTNYSAPSAPPAQYSSPFGVPLTKSPSQQNYDLLNSARRRAAMQPNAPSNALIVADGGSLQPSAPGALPTPMISSALNPAFYSLRGPSKNAPKTGPVSVRHLFPAPPQPIQSSNDPTTSVNLRQSNQNGMQAQVPPHAHHPMASSMAGNVYSGRASFGGPGPLGMTTSGFGGGFSTGGLASTPAQVRRSLADLNVASLKFDRNNNTHVCCVVFVLFPFLSVFYPSTGSLIFRFPLFSYFFRFCFLILVTHIVSIFPGVFILIRIIGSL